MSFYNIDNQSRRDRILHAALKLFHSKGFFKTSVHEIREQADVSIGLVYRYFKNKEEIAQTVYSELLQETMATMETIISETPSARECSKAIITLYLQMTENYPEIVDFVIFARHREIMPEGEPICAKGPPELIRAMVKQGMKNGEIRSMNLAVAAASIFGSTIRLIQLRLAGMVDAPLPSLRDEIFETAWNSVANCENSSLILPIRDCPT